MKCKNALLLMDSVIDNQCTPEENQLFRFHINGCASCEKIYHYNKSISQQVKKIVEPEPSADLLESIQRRLASGNYDSSTLSPQKKFHLPSWKIAAVIPFAAALVLILQNFTGPDESHLRGNSMETISIQKNDIQYAPAPVVAYSRPSSVSTF